MSNVETLAAARRSRGPSQIGGSAPLEPPAGAIVCDPQDPIATARQLLENLYRHDCGLPVLRHWRGSFYQWTGSRYEPVDDVDGRAWLFLEAAFRRDRRAEGVVPFQPTRRRVIDVVAALAAVAALPSKVEPPAWLDHDEERPPAAEFIAVANGLLHMSSLELWPASPAFFSTAASPVAYDPEAASPDRWREFLGELWPDDPDSRDCLQECFGYFLSGGLALHKAVLIVGPPRAGKGIIAHTLAALVGKENVCGPTLASLNENFGLEQLIGKSLALVGDARLSGRADKMALTERLLTITGGDRVTINRKHQSSWTGILPTRFLLTTNELPSFEDTSGAIASRFVLLQLRESFEGREDFGLAERLTDELAGILNWAVAGLARLTGRRRFTQPPASEEAMRILRDLASPVGAFLRDCCRRDPSARILREELFAAFRTWAEQQGYDGKRIKASTFGKVLTAAAPYLRSAQERVNGEPKRFYVGITLLPEV